MAHIHFQGLISDLGSELCLLSLFGQIQVENIVHVQMIQQWIIEEVKGGGYKVKI